MDVTQSGANILTRWYAGNSYMKESAAGVTKEYTYPGGDAYTVPVAAITQSGTTTYYYLLRDYLGSITRVVNATTNVASEYSFDVWGRRRNPADWSYTLTNQPALFADSGFTSHEFLSSFQMLIKFTILNIHQCFKSSFKSWSAETEPQHLAAGAPTKLVLAGRVSFFISTERGSKTERSSIFES